MLWLKLTLVILILEIGERAMCSDSCSMDAKSSPKALPQSSLLNTTDDKGCKYQVLADWDTGDFLIVNCTKTCPKGERSTVTNGQTCILKVTGSTGSDEVTVSVGTCNDGTCVTPKKPDCRTITPPEPVDEEDEEDTEEDEEQDEEEGEEETEEEEEED
uniref:Putative secreted salivary gland peptide n=1 Tax=Ixodes ricinus TaxID=34613 RepID=A0A0K8RH81_IXORI